MLKPKRLFFLLIIILGGGFILGAYFSSTTTPNSYKQLENKIFNLSFTNYNGDKINMSQFKGKSLVINSWASWCIYCKEELPQLSQVQAEYKDKIVFLAVNRAETAQQAKEFTDSLALNSGLHLLIDSDDSFFRAIGATVMPQTLFLNKKGEIIYHSQGAMDAQEIRDQINKIL